MSTFTTFSYLALTATLVFLTLILGDNNNGVSAFHVVDDSKDLILSYSEKKALDKLKLQIMDILPENFMKSDFYLIRWIRMAKLDVAKAQDMLIKNIQWREKNNISRIMEENFSDLAPDYHVTFGGRDKTGRPFGCVDMGQWDLLGSVITGKKRRLQHYLHYVTERAVHELFKAQQESPQKSITRGTIIVDGDGGSVRNLCPACISILFQWIREMELYYPNFLREIIVINAPSITQMALKALRPAMSQETSDIIHIFDTNKKVWMEYLDKIIDRSQRLPRYGGTQKELNI